MDSTAKSASVKVRKPHKDFGPVRLGNMIQVVRSVFRYGHEANLLDCPVKFGPGFKKPSTKTLRKLKAANGPRLVLRNDLQAMLDHSTVNTKAMLLLANNGGRGNTDAGVVPIKLFDHNAGWLDYPRAKIGVGRRVPLWRETVAVIQAVIANRPASNDAGDTDLLFIGPRGKSYRDRYRVQAEFAGVRKRAGVLGVTFNDLRRTFQTIGEGAHDPVAVQAIMGHAPASRDMSAVYRQEVSDERLKAVAEYVRRWLYGDNLDDDANES